MDRAEVNILALKRAMVLARGDAAIKTSLGPLLVEPDSPSIPRLMKCVDTVVIPIPQSD